jgi:hypothetical protein
MRNTPLVMIRKPFTLSITFSPKYYYNKNFVPVNNQFVHAWMGGCYRHFEAP